MINTDNIIQIVTAFCGTLGFGILFNIKGKKLFLAALGGMISCLLFLILGAIIQGEILRSFIVAALLTLYSEILARKLKTPAATFCIVSLIPLIPGSNLYYTMSYALSGKTEDFFAKAAHTLGLAAALSLGIIVVTALSRFAFKKK